MDDSPNPIKNRPRKVKCPKQSFGEIPFHQLQRPPSQKVTNVIRTSTSSMMRICELVNMLARNKIFCQGRRISSSEIKRGKKHFVSSSLLDYVQVTQIIIQDK